ncbi:MAG: dockerin type I repeat-containing protein [Clostridia bacterium]|nr:dockerin type I repeat-containing protein [Clostridia bacterium]
MKKVIVLLIVMLVIFNFTTVIYAMPPAYLESLEIDSNENITICIGDEITLEAIAEPSGVDYAYFWWTTDNNNAIILTENDKTLKREPPISTATIKTTEFGTVVVTVYADLSSEYFEPELYPDSYEHDSVTIYVIPDCSLGDANGDSAIDVKDVISVRQHLAGGYDATVFEPLADVNKDNTIDVRDIITLRRFIAGGYGIEIK